MPYQVFATVTGAKQGAFKGESTQKGREGKIAITSISYGVTIPRDATSGLATGRRIQHPVIFSKHWGVSSPQFSPRRSKTRFLSLSCLSTTPRLRTAA